MSKELLKSTKGLLESMDNHYNIVKQTINNNYTPKNIIVIDINNMIDTINGILALGYIDEKQHGKYVKMYQGLLNKCY